MKHSIQEAIAAARAYALGTAPIDSAMVWLGHARYMGTDERGDVFLTGISARYVPCHWDAYVVVSPETLAVRVIPEGELVFGYRPATEAQS